MDSSSEPVSKYRVRVSGPGRPEYILFSGAPTCLGHCSLFFEEQLRRGQFVLLRAPRNLLQFLADPNLI